MANAQFALKITNLLRREANAKAGICTDSRLGKTKLSIADCEHMEDQLDAEITRPMIGTESVTEKGDQLARDIKARYFATIPI